MESNMKMINAAVTTYVTEVVERLSKRYGFASAEALAYLGSGETTTGTAAAAVSIVAPAKQGRPEKKVKKAMLSLKKKEKRWQRRNQSRTNRPRNRRTGYTPYKDHKQLHKHRSGPGGMEGGHSDANSKEGRPKEERKLPSC